MAEVFGTASAAIGVVAATGQLIDGIMKLNTFCKDIRDIPDDIQNAVEDLVSLHEVLDSIQAEMGQGGPADRIDLRSSVKVLATLQQSSRQVDEVLKEMQQKLGKQRYWGRIKAIGMKRKLEKAFLRAQSAQSLMLMMLTTDCRMLIRQGFDAQKDDFAAISSLVTTAINTHQVSSQEAECGMITVDAQSPSIMEEEISMEDAAFPPPRRKSRMQLMKSRTIRLNWPTWLLSQAWELNVRQATNGWDFSMRSYRIVPADADIFLAIDGGDLDKVRQLLSSGEASKWDRYPCGFTVLHAAAHGCSYSENGLAIFELLVNMGVDINSTTFGGYPVQRCLPGYDEIYNDSSAQLRLVKAYRIFISHPEWITEPFLWNPSGTGIESGTFDLFSNPPPEAVQLALNQTWPLWNQSALSDRLESLFPNHMHYNSQGSPLSIRACLGSPDFFRNSIAQCDIGTKTRLASYALLALSYRQAIGQHREAEEARRILKDVLDMGMSSIFYNVFNCWESRSPLYIFVEEYFFGKTVLYRSRTRKLKDIRLSKMMSWFQEGLKCYASEMMLLGLEQLPLIEAEVKHRRSAGAEPGSRKRVDIFAFDEAQMHFGFRVIGLDFSLGVDNWQLWLSNPLDEWAGDFWEMIEHPERRIPGAWDESYDRL